MSNLAIALPTSLLQVLSFSSDAFKQEAGRRLARRAALMAKLSQMAKLGEDLRSMLKAARYMEVSFAVAIGLGAGLAVHGAVLAAGLTVPVAPLFFFPGLAAGLYFFGKSADDTERFAQNLADAVASSQTRK